LIAVVCQRWRMVELRVPRCCLLAKSPPVECCWRGRGRMTVLPERRAVIAWAPVRGWSGVCSARRLTASAALRQRRQRIGRELRGLGSCETTCSTDAAVPLLRGLRPLPLQPLGWMDGWMGGLAHQVLHGDSTSIAAHASRGCDSRRASAEHLRASVSPATMRPRLTTAGECPTCFWKPWRGPSCCSTR
jgi:hypothetical protein